MKQNKIIRISTDPLTTSPERIKNMKLSKGNELKIEMSSDNWIILISAGPTKSEGNGRASPIQMEGDSTELYCY
jgi:hypothetical protein